MKKWARGEFDVWCPILGKNGAGKTTLAHKLVSEYAQSARVLISDPDGQFSAFGQAHASSDAYRKYLKSTDKAPTVARFDDRADIGSLFQLGRDLASASNFQTPSLIMIDEGSAWADAAKLSQIKGELRRAVTRRRNDACGALIIYQLPAMLHYSNLSNATRLYVFRMESKYHIVHLRQQLPDVVKLASGQTCDADALCAALPTLGRGAYYEIDKSF